MFLGRVDLREDRYEADHDTLQCKEKLWEELLDNIIINVCSTAAQAKRIMENVLTKVVLPWYNKGSCKASVTIFRCFQVVTKWVSL